MHEEIRIGPNCTDRRELVKYALEYRKELLRTKPIMSEHITRLDNWLIKEPSLPLAAVCQIWTRIMWASACDYEQEQDPLIKHFTLLEIREHFQDFCQLSERWQEALGPPWMTWLDVLNSEEEKWEQRNARS